MINDDWQSLWTTFHRIVPLPYAERKQALAELPADQAMEIASLLDSHDQAHSLLDSPPMLVHAPEPGRRIGVWKLVELIGEGGMGQVWRAERADGAYQSEVAVKLLAIGLAGPILSERLAREREILARLEHPDIARLLDGGTLDNGQPYLVMDYVRGQPLDVYCRDRSLSIKQRLELMVRICAAVDHAHRRLIVHRDLKPGNILVTGEGAPRLLDFGIARLLTPDDGGEQSGARTIAAERLLTPDYASPEQLLGEAVDTRSDVYSLGVVLYELLSGRRPWSSGIAGQGELRQRLTERRPLPPSRAVESIPEKRRLRGDLDRIVLRAIDPDPDRRYAAARELGQDIERYLKGFPILARPPNRRYRMRRFVGRHPLGVSAITVVLALGLAAGTALWLQARALEQALEHEQRATLRAESLSAFLAELLIEADPQVHQGEPRSVDDVLADAATRIENDFSDQPALKSELLTTLARIFISRGDYEEARSLVEQSLAVHPDAVPALLLQVRLDLIDGKHANVVAGAADLIERESASAARQARLMQAEAYQAMDDLEAARQTLDHLGAVDEEAGEDAIEAWFRQGGLHWGSGDFVAAEASYREALEQQIKLHGSESTQAARGLNAIASARYRQGDLEAAETLFRRVLSSHESILGPHHPQTAETRVRLGALLYDRQDFTTSVSELERALVDQQTAFDDDHPALANTLNNLALALAGLGRFDEAAARFAEALTINQTAHGPTHSKAAGNLANLGWMKIEQNQPEQALPLLRQALTFQQAALPDNHPEIAYTLHHLGRAAMMSGHLVDSEDWLKQALSIRRAAYASDHPLIADTLLMLGHCYQSVDSPDLAHAAWREALTIREQRFGTDGAGTREVRELLQQ